MDVAFVWLVGHAAACSAWLCSVLSRTFVTLSCDVLVEWSDPLLLCYVVRIMPFFQGMWWQQPFPCHVWTCFVRRIAETLSGFYSRAQRLCRCCHIERGGPLWACGEGLRCRWPGVQFAVDTQGFVALHCLQYCIIPSCVPFVWRQLVGQSGFRFACETVGLRTPGWIAFAAGGLGQGFGVLRTGLHQQQLLFVLCTA